MIEEDSIKLLRECDAGIKMGISAIEEVLQYVQNPSFKNSLEACKTEHNRLKKDIENALNRFSDTGKNPNPIAKSMSWVKTNLELLIDESDHTIADLITDGCNMGVKSLCRYLNQYAAADEAAKDIAKRLIRQEEKLCSDCRAYL